MQPLVPSRENWTRFNRQWASAVAPGQWYLEAGFGRLMEEATPPSPIWTWSRIGSANVGQGALDGLSNQDSLDPGSGFFRCSEQG